MVAQGVADAGVDGLHGVGDAFQGNVAAGVSSPGFCGGWFIWCRRLPVVIVRGGGCRVPRRLRARLGFAYRWRSEGEWCPPSGPTRRWRARAASMSSQGPWLRISSALYKEFSASARAKPKGIPLRAYRGDRLALGQGLPHSGWTCTYAPRSQVVHQARQVGPLTFSLPDGHLQGV